MKEKIIIFAVGLLSGAIIASGCFFVYERSKTCNNSNHSIRMNNNFNRIPGANNNQGGQMPNGNDSNRPSRPNEGTNDNQNKQDSSNNTQNNNM